MIDPKLEEVLSHLYYTLYYNQKFPRSIGICIDSSVEFSGEDFLNALDYFVEKLRPHQENILTPGFDLVFAMEDPVGEVN